MFLSILSGSRSMGGGDVWVECREQGPLSPSCFFPLPFSLVLSVLRLGVTAPVCASCLNPIVRESKEVCLF